MDLNKNKNDEEGLIEKNFNIREDLIITTKDDKVDQVFDKKPEVIEYDN
jgi:hypothetical protein